MAEGTGTKPVVIVGGGEAGGTAAATLREGGFSGPIVIINAEPGIPFGRPPLSKTYLRSEEDLSGWYVKPGDWYAAHDVELLADSTVTAIDATATIALRENAVVVSDATGERWRHDFPSTLRIASTTLAARLSCGTARCCVNHSSSGTESGRSTGAARTA